MRLMGNPRPLHHRFQWHFVFCHECQAGSTFSAPCLRGKSMKLGRGAGAGLPSPGGSRAEPGVQKVRFRKVRAGLAKAESISFPAPGTGALALRPVRHEVGNVNDAG